MTALLAIIALSAAIGFFLGYASKSDAPVKRSIEQMNAEEAERAENRRLSGHVEILQDLLAEIYMAGVTSSSGTARKMAQMAKGGVAK